MGKGKNGSGGGGNKGGKGPVAQLLTGTEGNDFLFADAGNDTLDALGGDDRLFGLDGDDLLLGGEGNDELDGGFGNDTLDGGAGDDFLTGSYGSDVIDGGSMSGECNTAAFTNVDAIVLTAGTEAGTYTSTNEPVSGSAQDMDTLVNIHRVVGSNFDDAMTGGDFDDFFMGAEGHDTLAGGAGDDTLFGGLDNDVMTGGEGADTFVFVRLADGLVAGPGEDPAVYADPGTGDGYDIITDFELGVDRLLFLSNEAMDISLFSATYDAAGDYTELTYQAEPDYFGPSVIILQGVNASLADLVHPDTDFQVSADFDFAI